MEALRCSWRRTDGWHHRTVDRGVALSQFGLVSSPLAVCRSPVTQHASWSGTSTRSRPIIVTSSPSCRSPAIWGGKARKVARASSGAHAIRRAGRLTVDADLGSLAPEQWAKASWPFAGLNASDEQVADAYHARDADGWTTAVRVLRRYPRALLALYAAFLPPCSPS